MSRTSYAASSMFAHDALVRFARGDLDPHAAEHAPGHFPIGFFTGDGPVMPRCASLAANAALRLAFA